MKSQSLLVFAAALWGALGTAHAGTLIAFNPSGPLTIGNSGTATVGLVVSNLPEPLAAWNIYVLFSPSSFSIDPVTGVTYGDPVLGDQLGSGLGSGITSLTNTQLVTLNPTTSELQLAEVSFASTNALAAQFPSFTLATMTFTGVPGAQQALSFQIAPSGFVGGTGNVIVPPTTVPEPATWLLGAAGLAGVALLRRRRRSHPA